MIQILAAGLADGGLVSGAPAFELGRGAIAGAFIIGAAFLAGYAAIRRSGLAVCALLMVAGVLLFFDQFSRIAGFLYQIFPPALG